MRIDFISSLFVISVTMISVPLAGSELYINLTQYFLQLTVGLNPGLVGLALTYAISLNGMFQFCVRQSAEVESLVNILYI